MGLDTPDLRGKRTRLTLARDSDARPLLEFHDRNVGHLRPWMPPLPDDLFTLAYWQKWVQCAQWLYEHDKGVRLVVRCLPNGPGSEQPEPPAGPIIGQVNFSNILRGPFQACHLGYHIDAGVEGRGLMSEALRLAIRLAFDELGLHRVMANYIPTNERSARLLSRLGFKIEGYAKDYLFIDGAWRDHVMTALTNPRSRPPHPETHTSPLTLRRGL